jgi:hypothetical protein
MKNTILLAILAVALVLGITACGDVGGGGGGGSKVNNPQTVTYSGVSGGTTYTLKITEKTARYAAQSGDAYELTAGSKTSAGEVSNVAGGELTLKPSNSSATFTAAVSESGITEMGGTITWSDNTTQPAPVTITPGGPTTDSNGAIIGGVSGCTITAAVTGVPSNVTIDFINGWGEPLSNYISGASVKVSGGKAVIKLGVPTNEYLGTISEEWYFSGDDNDEIPNGITVSAPDVKVTRGFDIGFFGSDDDYNLFCEKDEDNFACLVYADKDVTIKGTYTYTATYDSKTYTETYNVSLKAGWNYYLIQRNEATNTTTYTASTTLPAGFSWKVELW